MNAYGDICHLRNACQYAWMNRKRRTRLRQIDNNCSIMSVACAHTWIYQRGLHCVLY